MNPKSILASGLCVLGAFSALYAQPLNVSPSPAASATPAAKGSVPPAVSPVAAASAATFSQAQLLELIGWYFGKQTQVETFGFTPSELEIVQKGFAAAAIEKDMSADLDKALPQLQTFSTQRTEAFMAKLKKRGQDESDALFAKLRTQTGVTVLPSGLAYEILKAGTGPNAKTSDTITAHYTAMFASGKVFDTSRVPSETGGAPEPAKMPLAGAIPGLLEGLQKANKGSRIKLYVPPKLAFGEEGNADIPPGSTIIFDIEVTDITPTPGPASVSPLISPLNAPMGR